MIKTYVLFLLILSSQYTFCKTKIDSLKLLYSKEVSDTGKVKYLVDLIQEYIYLKNYNESERHIKQLALMVEKINTPKYIGVLYLCQGELNENIGNKVKAIEFYVKCTENYKAANLLLPQASLYGWIGNLHYGLGNIPQSLEYFIRAVKIYEQLEDKESAAGYMGNIGAIYEVMEKYEIAYEWYQKSLKLNREINAKQNIAINLVCIGILKVDLQEYDKAINYLNEALAINIELGNNEYICNNYSTLATCYTKMKNYEKALDYSLKAKNLAQITKNDREYLSSLVNQTNCLINLKKTAESEVLIKECIKLIKEYPSNELKLKVYKVIAEYYEIKGNLKEQIYYYKLHVAFKDSILNSKNSEKLVLQQAQYEYEKKAAADSVKVAEEKKISDLKLTQEKTQKNYLYVSLVIITVFGLFMFNRFRITKKQKNIIEFQKIEVEQQKALVDEKQKEILDSIHYAKRIQDSLMVKEKYIKEKINKDI